MAAKNIKVTETASGSWKVSWVQYDMPNGMNMPRSKAIEDEDDARQFAKLVQQAGGYPKGKLLSDYELTELGDLFTGEFVIELAAVVYSELTDEQKVAMLKGMMRNVW